jgi:hypothetical protein
VHVIEQQQVARQAVEPFGNLLEQSRTEKKGCQMHEEA